MKKLTVILVVFMLAITAHSQTPGVKTGIEVLRDNGFSSLAGKRVALITNPTGVDSHLRHTADILHEAPGVELVALLAPEHGIRGDVAAGARVSDAVDPATGVKVYSLYGNTKKPTAAMLQGVDAIVYDIQDNGCRSFTFVSTMAKAMEAAAEHGLEFVVLDRPNPLGGNRVEGGMVDADCRSFVSEINVPYIYGFTPGELAGYLLGEGLIKAPGLKLTVVEMEGWRREMEYGDTGLPWVLPSPHVPEATTALYYPATGIVGELDFVSIGVGYTLPFRTFAAPWIDADKLAGLLNGYYSQDGSVAWRPIHYKPYYGKFKGEDVHGVQLFILNGDASLTMPQFHFLEAVAALWPARSPLTPTEKNSGRLRMFDQVTGTKEIRRTLLSNGYESEGMLRFWQPSEQFMSKREGYFLYP